MKPGSKVNPSQQTIQIAAERYQSGRLAEALELCREILRADPGNAHALHLQGLVAHGLGDAQGALEALEKAVSLDPSDASLLNNLGEIYRGLGRLEEAETRYRKALALKSDYTEAHYNLGRVLQALGRTKEAAQSYDRHGSELQKLGRVEEAAQSHRRALALQSDFAEAHYNLGTALSYLRRYSEAAPCFVRALELKPDFVDAHINLGNCFKGLGRLEEAERSYRRALELKPNHPVASYNCSLVKLLLGEYRVGFKLYELRFEGEGGAAAYFQYMSGQLGAKSFWQGEHLEGRTLLLWQEQGAGDCIMAMRYLSQLKERRAGRVMIHCDASLARLAQTFGVVDEVVVRDRPLSVGTFDCHCPIMSLPRLFDTTVETIPNQVPYLRVPEDLSRKWANKFGGVTPLRVGFAWAGGKLLPQDALRSIPLEVFAPLLGVAGVNFVSLQKGEAADRLKGGRWKILDWMSECEDFLDTAALVEQLDLVVSVDTAVAHLAGALGKPVWLLSRFDGDWRWMPGREDSPWYPTMRIFRQTKTGDWGEVMTRVTSALQVRVYPGRT